jgi:hypothetical protein
MTLSITTFSMMIFSIEGLFATFSINDTQQKTTFSIMIFSIEVLFGTFSMKVSLATFSINETQYNDIQHKEFIRNIQHKGIYYL